MPRKLPKKGSQNLVALEPQLAIATIGIFSMLVDGEMGDIENYALGEFLSEVDLYADYSEDDFDNLAAEALSLLHEDPSAGISQAIVSLEDKGSREAAYITALLVISIDGEIPPEEEDYIADLQKALNISDKRAVKIIDELFGEDDEDEEDEE
jgi:tellurite resistance protein